jgi:hypothetical protein
LDLNLEYNQKVIIDIDPKIASNKPCKSTINKNGVERKIITKDAILSLFEKLGVQIIAILLLNYVIKEIFKVKLN